MRGQHLGGRALGSDRPNTDPNVDSEGPATDGGVSSAWAIAFVVVVLLGLLSPFLS
jgi:hypothetical protein